MKLPETKTLRVFLILTILGLAFIKFVILPYESKIKEKKEVYAELVNAYIQKKEVYEKMKKLQLQKPEETPKEESFIFPKNSDPQEIQLLFSKELKEIAENQKLELLNFELPEPSSGKTITEIPVIIRVKGKPKDIISYLEELQKALIKKKKVFKVSEAVLSGDRANVNLTLRISVFKTEL